MDIVQIVLTTDIGVSEFVILHESYGSGKSHALRYFSTLVNEIQAERFRSVAIYVPKVKLSEKVSFLELYFRSFNNVEYESHTQNYIHPKQKHLTQFALFCP